MFPYSSEMDTSGEIAELDAEIDAEVFDLYDLDEDEVKTVLDALDVDEAERQRIHKHA